MNNDVEKKKYRYGFPILLFVYHLIFTFVAYQYYLKNSGDAQLYWFLKQNQNLSSWGDYFAIGSDFVLFLNYPFAIIGGFPILFGFLFYSFIGYVAIINLYTWSLQWIPNPPQFFGISVLQLIVFMPNLHFWTARLGKESLILLALIFIFQVITSKAFFSLKFFLGVFLLVMIRPHVAFFLLLALLLYFVFWNSKEILKKKLLAMFIAVPVVTGLLYSVLQLTQIRYWDWERIKKFNNYSLQSFQHADSYVPMVDYSLFEKVFAFNFRPFFFDASSLITVGISFENVLVLIILVSTIGMSVIYYKKIQLNVVSKIIVIFALVSCLFYIQRYACLGIFLRTKVMYMPFLLIVCVYLYSQIRTIKDKQTNKL